MKRDFTSRSGALAFFLGSSARASVEPFATDFVGGPLSFATGGDLIVCTIFFGCMKRDFTSRIAGRALVSLDMFSPTAAVGASALLEAKVGVGATIPTN